MKRYRNQRTPPSRVPLESGEFAQRRSHYDGSGAFAYSVGLPAKSGVDGGILAIAPRAASIAVWSPGLNAHSNSKLGTLAAEMLADRDGWSVFC